MSQVVNYLTSREGQSYIIYGVTVVAAGGLAYAIYKRFMATKVVIPCFGCDPGGTWYKCAPGTGAGSEQCDIYKSITGAIETIESEFKNVIDAIISLEKAIEDPFADAEKMFANIASKIPSIAVVPMKKIEQVAGQAISAIPDCGIPELNKLIGVDLDPCKLVKGSIMTSLKAVDNVISFINKEIQSVVGDLTRVVQGMLAPIEDALLEIVAALMKPWQAVSDEIKGLIKKLTTLLVLLKNNIAVYLQGMVYEMLDIGIISVGTLLGLLAASSSMMFVGGLVGNYTFLKKLIALPSQVVSIV